MYPNELTTCVGVQLKRTIYTVCALTECNVTMKWQAFYQYCMTAVSRQSSAGLEHHVSGIDLDHISHMISTYPVVLLILRATMRETYDSVVNVVTICSKTLLLSTLNNIIVRFWIIRVGKSNDQDINLVWPKGVYLAIIIYFCLTLLENLAVIGCHMIWL